MHQLILGRYRLDERLQTSATAEVWLATDTTGGGRVVVKRLHPDLVGAERAVRRFQAEVAATAAVRHPALVRLLDAGPLEMVLEHVAGETLAARIARGPMPARDVTQGGADVAAALAALHAAELVHRDVSPSNVLLDPTGRAHLFDLGNAIAAGSRDELAGSGWIVGTRRYVAPEVLAGSPATPASDVWALGATLSEALAGRQPEGAVTETADGPLARLLAQMLDSDPATRPSAAGVASTLAPAPMATTELLPVVPPADAPPAGRTLRAAGLAALPSGAPAWGGVARPSPALAGRSRAHRLPAIARRTAVAVAGVLFAAGATLAAAGPVEPPSAADGQRLGPMPLPTSSAPAATPAPSSPPGSLAAHRTLRAVPPRGSHRTKRKRHGKRSGGRRSPRQKGPGGAGGHHDGHGRHDGGGHDG